MLQPLMIYEPSYNFHQDSSAINPGSLVYRSANSASSTADMTHFHLVQAVAWFKPANLGS